MGNMTDGWHKFNYKLKTLFIQFLYQLVIAHNITAAPLTIEYLNPTNEDHLKACKLQNISFYCNPDGLLLQHATETLQHDVQLAGNNIVYGIHAVQLNQNISSVDITNARKAFAIKAIEDGKDTEGWHYIRDGEYRLIDLIFVLTMDLTGKIGCTSYVNARIKQNYPGTNIINHQSGQDICKEAIKSFPSNINRATMHISKIMESHQINYPSITDGDDATYWINILVAFTIVFIVIIIAIVIRFHKHISECIRPTERPTASSKKGPRPTIVTLGYSNVLSSVSHVNLENADLV